MDFPDWYQKGSTLSFGESSPEWENSPNEAGDQKIGPKQEILSQMGDHFLTMPCASLGVPFAGHENMFLLSAQITLLHRAVLLQNFTVYAFE